MSDFSCAAFAECVTDVVGGAVGDSARAEAAAHHAAKCSGCAALLRRERALLAALRGLPDAPLRTLVPPRLPDEPAVRSWPEPRRRVAWAAAAVAACVVAGVVSAWTVGGGGAAGRGDPGGVPGAGADSVASLRIVDDGDPFPAWDDRLLGLAAGAEHLAARWPAEDR